MAAFKHTILALWLALIALSAWSAAATGSRKFLGEAWQDGKAEIQVCHLALEKTSNPEVRKFAERMIADHSRIDQQIALLAKKKNISLPKDISAQQKSAFDRLAKLSGTAFDREFMEHNIQDHEKDVKEFWRQADQASDPEIREFAANTLKLLSEHLELAKQVRAAVKA